MAGNRIGCPMSDGSLSDVGLAIQFHRLLGDRLPR
jgi:hypothetical protein